ncbi:ubiquinone anaerobic biosynthesis accessory factor UbiT [Brevundimonas sp.]|uniref:ubiquinone anaerobic biosynthesis accessory factor UbiT n=1 Tax=Brevundimonas sp. TaxID=1871086 RepID=UPI002B783DD3|nr:SCP2 sterol-binding domain-containing protein [Brevundimonas sp.]HWQ87300.1 SCP2 sterol-binding domain-containing protein [Brevundimonas sp.]
MTGRATAGRRSGGLRRAAPGRGEAATFVLMALRDPVERLLTLALRRVARRRPDVFERLGEAGDVTFIVAPTDFPVAFRLRPGRGSGNVQVVRVADAPPHAARISGPLLTLLALFDGRCDADSAFFSRRIRVDGDTRAVVALHNTLEAAELTLADLLGVGPPFRDRLNAGLAGALNRLRPLPREL